jgi:hypothetical protein
MHNTTNCDHCATLASVTVTPIPLCYCTGRPAPHHHDRDRADFCPPIPTPLTGVAPVRNVRTHAMHNGFDVVALHRDGAENVYADVDNGDAIVARISLPADSLTAVIDALTALRDTLAG